MNLTDNITIVGFSRTRQFNWKTQTWEEISDEEAAAWEAFHNQFNGKDTTDEPH